MNRAFTLMELLIVIAIFALFSLTLVVFLNAGVLNWGTTKDRNIMESEARTITEIVRKDLLSAAPRTPDAYDRFWLSLYYDGKQVTGFSIVTPEEMKLAMLTAGDGKDNDGDNQKDEEIPDFLDNDVSENGVDDDGDGEIDEEAFNGIDDDLDGLIDEDCFGDGYIDEDCMLPDTTAAVMYSVDPFRADSSNMLLEPRPILWRGITWGTVSPANMCFKASASNIHRYFVPISSRCLYFELRYALTQTTTWDTAYLPQEDGNNPFGPETKWDSRRIFSTLFFGSSSAPQDFTDFIFRSDSPLDSDEHVFPRRVLLVMGIVPDNEPFTFLTQSVDADDNKLYLQTTDGMVVSESKERENLSQMVLIDEEWIMFNGVGARSIDVAKRGARYSTAASHAEDTPVYFPRTFTAEIYIPTGFTPE